MGREKSAYQEVTKIPLVSLSARVATFGQCIWLVEHQPEQILQFLVDR
jgi:hypothetical protein